MVLKALKNHNWCLCSHEVLLMNYICLALWISELSIMVILVSSLCDALNYFFVLIVFVLSFNISTLQSLAFGIFFQWHVLEMLRFSDLYFQCSLSTICNINFVIWLCLHYFLFEMLHFSLDLIFSKHQATTLLLLVPLFLSFVKFFVLYRENI